MNSLQLAIKIKKQLCWQQTHKQLRLSYH